MKQLLFFAIGILVAVAIGIFMRPDTAQMAPETSKMDEWCFFAEYPSLQSYRETKPLQNAFIEFKGKAVVVHAKCSALESGNLY